MFKTSVNNKRLIRNTTFLYFRMLFAMLVTFYTTRVILQALGVIDYGIYNVVAGFVLLFGVFSNSLATAINRYYNFALGNNDIEGVNKVFNASLRIQIIIIIILLIILELIGVWYINNIMVVSDDKIFVANFVFQTSVVSLLFVVMQIPYSAAVLAYERMDFYAIVSVIDAICKLGIAFVVANLNYGKLEIYGILLSCISLFDFIIYLIYTKRNIPILKYNHKVDSGIFRSLLGFSGLSMIDPFSYLVRDQGSNLTLNVFFGPVLNAAYGIAAQVSGAISSFASNLSIAFKPQIIQAYSNENYSRVKSLMFGMSKINFILQMCIAIPLVFEMQYVLTLWLGDNYPQYTVIFASIVVITNSVNCLNEPVSIIMVATGHIKKIKLISMIIICSVVPIGYLLFLLDFPPYSIYIVMFIITLVNQYSCVLIMCQKFNYINSREYFSSIITPLFLFALLSIIPPLIINVFIEFSFLRFLLTFIISIVFSLCLAYILCLNKNEQEMFMSIFVKIKAKLS